MLQKEEEWLVFSFPWYMSRTTTGVLCSNKRSLSKYLPSILYSLVFDTSSSCLILHLSKTSEWVIGRSSKKVSNFWREKKVISELFKNQFFSLSGLDFTKLHQFSLRVHQSLARQSIKRGERWIDLNSFQPIGRFLHLNWSANSHFQKKMFLNILVGKFVITTTNFLISGFDWASFRFLLSYEKKCF